MEIFGEDFIFGNFRASEAGFKICSFENNSDSEDELFAVETTETFLGDSPRATYEGQKYNFKLSGTITIMNDPCGISDPTITEYDCRNVMRQITGKRGYQWMKMVTDDIGEDLWYRARVVGVKLKRIGGKPVGLIIDIETDSYLAYSQEIHQTLNLSQNNYASIDVNTDDMDNYIYPYVTITPQSSGQLVISNYSEGEPLLLESRSRYSYDSVFDNVYSYTDIELDGNYKLLKYCLLDDFNMHWIRFVPGKNTFGANMNCTLEFTYRIPRKAGFVCR